MSRSMLPALAAACAVSFVAPALTAQQTVEEPKSHVAFPIRLTVPGGDQTHLLMGTGLRTKTFLKVKVYAFGLYVDSAAAREGMSAWAGKEHYQIEEDDSFYSALLEQDFAMTLRLVMTRNVDGETFADAFDGTLRPRVQQAAPEMNMPCGDAALSSPARPKDS